MCLLEEKSRPADPSLSPAASRSPDVPGVIAPPPLIYLAGLGLGFGLEALFPSASFPGWLSWSLGSVFILSGVALAVSFIRAFRQAGTPVNPGEPATALATTGPYRLSRNPGYLGMVSAYAGIAVLSGTVWVLASLVPVLLLIDRGVIRREERHLERRFGDDYRNYKSRTRRWI
jgi:protein-S-isoprenylcysteine O-methyltransferase Ste14